MNEKFYDSIERLMKEYGEDILKNIQKTKGLLFDLAPDMKPEVLLFVNLLNVNGYKDIKDADLSTFYRLMDKLEQYYFIKKDSAAWIINIMSKAINNTVFEFHYDQENIHKSRNITAFKHDIEEDVEHVLALGYAHTVALCKDGKVIATGQNDFGQCDVSKFTNVEEVYAGDNYTVAITSPRKVIAVGDNRKGQLNVHKWTDIKTLIPTRDLLLGIRNNGNVIAAGKNAREFVGNAKWENIIQVAAQNDLVAAIRDIGKVVTNNDYINVSHWRDIVSIAVSNSHVVGLRKDGKVMAAGRNNFYQCDVSNWTDIVQIAVGETNVPIIESAKEQLETIHEEILVVFASDDILMRKLDKVYELEYQIVQDFDSLENASSICLNNLEDEYNRIFILLNKRDATMGTRYKEAYSSLINCINKIDVYDGCSASHTVGLKSDGTVVATGFNGFKQCNVQGFYNVKRIIAGGFHTMALKYDKTVDICGMDRYNQHYVKSWKDVESVELSKTGEYILGLKSDGTLYNTGNDNLKQCSVDFWSNVGKNQEER